MLKKNLLDYLQNEENNNHKPIFGQAEMEYMKQNEIAVPQSAQTTADGRWMDAYLERCHKETEEMLAEETAEFLKQPISYFDAHKEEFLYMESPSLKIIAVDAVTVEMEDIFLTYEAILGLKLQKKHEKAIKEYLSTHLKGDCARYNLLFSQNDGLWDLNFPLDAVEGFNEQMTIEEAYELIFTFMFQLSQYVEANK